MKMSVCRYAGDLVPQLRKLHTPRKRGRLAPATAGGETALTSEEIADRDSRRTRVGGFPPRQFVTLHQEVARDHGAEKSAIKHSARAQKIERQERRRIVAVFRLGEEHQNFRADQ